MFITAMLLVKTRITYRKLELSFKNLFKQIQFMFQRRILLTRPMWSITLWFALTFLGYNLILFSFSTYATAVGLEESKHQTAIINASKPLDGQVWVV